MHAVQASPGFEMPVSVSLWRVLFRSSDSDYSTLPLLGLVCRCKFLPPVLLSGALGVHREGCNAQSSCPSCVRVPPQSSSGWSRRDQRGNPSRTQTRPGCTDGRAVAATACTWHQWCQRTIGFSISRCQSAVSGNTRQSRLLN